MSASRVDGFPLWLRDIDAVLPVTSMFVVHGAVRDVHAVPVEGSHVLVGTLEALWRTLARSGFDALLVHSPVHGLRVYPHGDTAGTAAARHVAELLGDAADLVGTQATYDSMVGVLGAVTGSNAARTALVLDYVSQAAPAGEPVPDGLHALMLGALAAVHRGAAFKGPDTRSTALHHPVFWFVDRPADLPSWLVAGDGIRQVPIPNPDLDSRRVAAGLLVASLPDPTLEAEATASLFAASTEGMSLHAMIEVIQLARDARVPAAQIDDAVRAYRVGLTENPWAGAYLREQLVHGRERLTAQVKGQSRAVQRTLDILVRSALGLTSAHQGRTGSGPRGVLFFAGPTGVGKTEMAKAVTRLVFGDDRALIRFDMSEFASEHAEARLLGSPPGYVGHGAGGELTNAVRRRPFAVLLFDEIEKAHPRILDKFLQVLSDGRLTDGSGATVHFSEAVIIFTSNLGAQDVDLTGVDDADREVTFEHQLRDSVERHFTDVLGRPELLGRIGDNIIVFSPLSPAVAADIARADIANVVERVRSELRVELVVPDGVVADLVARVTADLGKGGRGVGLALESAFVNPLARALFANPRTDRVSVASIGLDADGSPEVVLR